MRNEVFEVLTDDLKEIITDLDTDEDWPNRCFAGTIQILRQLAAGTYRRIEDR